MEEDTRNAMSTRYVVCTYLVPDFRVTTLLPSMPHAQCNILSTKKCFQIPPTAMQCNR
jgi:hypothetical protein